MKKIILLLMLLLPIVANADDCRISVQTKIFDANSQPPIVGGVIDTYEKAMVSTKGIIVSSSIEDMGLKINEKMYNPFFFYDVLKEYRILDCSEFGEEQFWCSLKLLKSDIDYYVRAFVVTRDSNVVLGNIEKIHTQFFSRYNGRLDYANVWHAFDHTLFDLMTDEIINPNNGFYYSTNENPTIVRHQVGTGYNTCYKYATEWNYKLWYYHNEIHCDKNKIVNMPIMTYANRKLTIEKNPIDAEKDIKIYYSINGSYFRPETYKDIYTTPIEIHEPCAIYCYAISSDGYISYTNMLYIDEITNSEGEGNNNEIKVADYVDLGLSVKWASWNIGADAPEADGYLLAWGELSPKENYSASTYRFYKNGYTKYGSIDNKYILDDEDDAACQLWGSDWRTPTIEELTELKEKCIFSLTQLNGVSVAKVTGPNGNSIFFPYPGNFTGDYLYYHGSVGSYWSRNLDIDAYALDLDFISGSLSLNGDTRYHGQSIRPVYVGDKKPDENNNRDDFGKEAEIVDLGLSVKWASWNIGASQIADYGGLYGIGDATGLRTNYSTEGYHRVEGECISGTEYDLAMIKWGSNWRIPTIDQLKELMDKCSWESNVVINGVKGVRATGPNGNQIFIPCAGTRQGSRFVDKDKIASLWSGNVGSTYYYGYEDLDLFFSGKKDINGNIAYIGQSIRPVYVDGSENLHNDVNGTVPDVVDLGLTSGTLWAAWNIGASSPEEYGAYFAWGETVPKNDYDWSTYKFGDGSIFTKYNTTDGLTQLELEDNAAYVILGEGWRIPTHEQELELARECSWENVTINGISGYQIIGPNGNSIFMPRGGLYDGTDYACDGTTLSNVNTCGWYWSSTLNSVGSSFAQGLCFFPSLLTNVSDHERCDGHNIRPVYVESIKPNDEIQANTLSVEDFSINLGYSQDLIVGLSNNKEIDGVQFDLTLPTGISIAMDRNDKYVVETTDRSNKLYTECGKLSDNLYRIILFSTKRETISTGDGDIIKIRLVCDEDATPGSYALSFTSVTLSCQEGNMSVNEFKDNFTSLLTVNKVSTIRGDVDGDYEVNITDVLVIVNYILGRPNKVFLFSNADMDKNGTVNITDALNVVNIILGKTSSSAPRAARQSDYDLLRMGSDETGCQVLTAAGIPNITAMQMDVVLPSDCRLKEVTLTGNASRTHQVMTNELENGRYRIVVFSTKKELLDTDAAILHLGTEGRGGLVCAESIQCFDEQNKPILSSDINAVLTGITTIYANDDNDTPIYNISGQRVSKNQQGINILNGRKVIVR